VVQLVFSIYLLPSRYINQSEGGDCCPNKPKRDHRPGHWTQSARVGLSHLIRPLDSESRLADGAEE